MRASSLGRTQETTVKTFVAKLATVAVAVSLLVVPAPPAVAATVPDVPAPVVYTPTDARAAERAARTLNRRVAPVAQVVAQPVVPVVQKRVKPVVKAKAAAKPVVKAVAKPALKKPAPTTEVVQAAASGSVAEVIRFLQSKVGSRYVWGAEGPSQFDCSGLSRAAYLRIGISLAHQSGAQAHAGRAVSRSQLRAGDLVIYSGHVGVAISATMMIHAANPRTGVVKAAIYGSPIGYRRIVG